MLLHNKYNFITQYKFNKCLTLVYGLDIALDQYFSKIFKITHNLG